MRYGELEARIGNHFNQLSKPTQKNLYSNSSLYRSKSEQIIANILARDGIQFSYEDDLHVPHEYTNGKSDKIWHPDFYLHDSGIIIEYVGMPDDDEYMRGFEKKKEVYEKMGVDVIWLFPEDLWEQTRIKKYGKLRDAVDENILGKIYELVRESNKNANPYSSFGLRIPEYQSQQGRRAA